MQAWDDHVFRSILMMIKSRIVI